MVILRKSLREGLNSELKSLTKTFSHWMPSWGLCEAFCFWVEAFLLTSNKSSLKITQKVEVLMGTYLSSSSKTSNESSLRPQLCLKTYFMNQLGNLEKKSLRRPKLRINVFVKDLFQGKSLTKTFFHWTHSWVSLRPSWRTISWISLFLSWGLPQDLK